MSDNILDDIFEGIQQTRNLNENINTKASPQKRGRKPKSVSTKQLKNTTTSSKTKINHTEEDGSERLSLISTLAQNSEDGDSLISKELARFEFQLNEQFAVLESIDPMDIIDIENRLKASKLKIELLQKLPALMSQLDELKTKEDVKIKAKGSRELSPVETGELDVFSEEDFKDLDDE